MKNSDIFKPQYAPTVQRIIDENTKFYNIKDEIEWEFFENEDTAIFAYHKGLKMYLNIRSVIRAFATEEVKLVEYFIVHEIRHIFQHIIIANDVNNSNSPLFEFANRCDYEFKHYIKMSDNLYAYYDQEIEFDAYSYAYAVILYKYGKIDYINKPSCYGDEFYERVNKLIESFKSKNL